MKPLSLKSERGTSLVEILVVMVVLLIGIFTVIRVFPVGFDILQYTGNATIGHRMADAEIEFWRDNSANLPEAIVSTIPGPPTAAASIDPVGHRPTDFIAGTGAFGDESGDLRNQIASALKGYYGSVTDDMIDLWVGPNQARRILGETATIPAPSPANNGVDASASIYTLAYGPIEWGSKSGGTVTSGIANQYLQITGQPLSRIDVTGLTRASLITAVSQLRPRQYAIDLNNATIYLPTSTSVRQFIASYSYALKSGVQIRSITADVLTVQANSTNGTIPGSVVQLGVHVSGNSNYDSAFSKISSDSDLLKQRFRFLSPSQPFDSDPYEFKTLARYTSGIQFSGAIAFNPNGYNQREPGAGGTLEPLRPSIDYTVKDWRILHQDITLPSSSPYRVRLNLPYIKQAGVTSEEGSLAPWSGLTDSQPAYSVVAVNPATGDVAVNSVSSNDNGFGVDYRNGVLTFSDSILFYEPSGKTRVISPAGLTLRVYYEVEGDWAVIPQKAYASYQVANWSDLFGSKNSTNVVPVGSVTAQTEVLKDDSGSTSKRYVRLVFPIPDEGKSVKVDYSYRDGNGQTKTVYNQNVQITSEARQTSLSSWFFKVSGSDVNELSKPYAMLYLPDDASIKNFSDDFALKRVQGTSFRVVTIWRDRSRWRQEAVNAYITRSNPS